MLRDQETTRLPRTPATPVQLRERAASIRWAARTIQDEARVRQLQEFADQLDAEATRLEAESATAPEADSQEPANELG
jgi:hypothetical protein